MIIILRANKVIKTHFMNNTPFLSIQWQHHQMSWRAIKTCGWTSLKNALDRGTLTVLLLVVLCIQAFHNPVNQRKIVTKYFSSCTTFSDAILRLHIIVTNIVRNNWSDVIGYLGNRSNWISILLQWRTNQYYWALRLN